MPQQVTLKLHPSHAADPQLVQAQLAAELGVDPSSVTGYLIIKQSIDARSRQPWIILTLQVFLNEQLQKRQLTEFAWKNVQNSPYRVLVAGSGPAGLFAALRLIEQGIKPIVIERGKDVKARRRDLAKLNKEGIVNPDSNYCFGEGGAGTYSDGKLYTRSNKRGNLQRILELFYHFGADEKILYQSHPHIGTNKLPHIITAMREWILQCGGEIHFENRLTNLLIQGNELKGAETNHSNKIHADAVILATGHSARDIFELLHQHNIAIEAKPFALGVRVEHPQSLIDSIQYHCPVRDAFLPPASYSLVEQVQGKGVFSFCMCPGGIIAPASTAPEELVVNGWSPSKRNNPFANSGMVVSVEEKDAFDFFKTGKDRRKIDPGHPLLMMYFQQAVERTAFRYGGGQFAAPAQRMVDYFNKINSASLPGCSYLPGLTSVNMQEVLPGFIHENLRLAFRDFGKKMKGYFTNDAVVVATESRTSSPVRIPRNPETLDHTGLRKLYPCGEGAGYAGGIISAAMDGEKVADAIASRLIPSSGMAGETIQR